MVVIDCKQPIINQCGNNWNSLELIPSNEF